jgi:hypothetical protein
VAHELDQVQELTPREHDGVAKNGIEPAEDGGGRSPAVSEVLRDAGSRRVVGESEEVRVQVVSDGVLQACVFPLAVVAFAVFRPWNTQPAALTISALLLMPIVLVGFRSRLIDALLLALPMWLGVRCGSVSVSPSERSRG